MMRHGDPDGGHGESCGQGVAGQLQPAGVASWTHWGFAGTRSPRASAFQQVTRCAGCIEGRACPRSQKVGHRFQTGVQTHSTSLSGVVTSILRQGGGFIVGLPILLRSGGKDRADHRHDRNACHEQNACCP